MYIIISEIGLVVEIAQVFLSFQFLQTNPLNTRTSFN